MLFVLLTIVVLSGTAGDLSVTRGMRTVGEVTDFHFEALRGTISRVLGTRIMWLGLVCKTISFFGFLALLRRADLSWVVPAGASSYLADTLSAKYLLGEHVSGARWAGVLCVGLGVALVSL